MFEAAHQRKGQGVDVVIGYVETHKRADTEELVEGLEFLPQFTPQHWWPNLLHTQTAFWLLFALLSKKGIVITEIPYQVR